MSPRAGDDTIAVVDVEDDRIARTPPRATYRELQAQHDVAARRSAVMLKGAESNFELDSDGLNHEVLDGGGLGTEEQLRDGSAGGAWAAMGTQPGEVYAASEPGAAALNLTLVDDEWADSLLEYEDEVYEQCIYLPAPNITIIRNTLARRARARDAVLSWL